MMARRIEEKGITADSGAHNCDVVLLWAHTHARRQVHTHTHTQRSYVQAHSLHAVAHSFCACVWVYVCVCLGVFSTLCTEIDRIRETLSVDGCSCVCTYMAYPFCAYTRARGVLCIYTMRCVAFGRALLGLFWRQRMCIACLCTYRCVQYIYTHSDS